MPAKTPIDHLKDYVKMDAYMLPSFINNQIITDKSCNEISICIFGQLYKLMSDVILTKKKNKYIVDLVNDYLNEMSLIDPSLSILYYEYYRDMLVGYLKYAIQNELWETCTNIRVFYEELYREKIVIDYE